MAEGNTGVFWDVVDFPIPECDPDLISKKINSALDEKGCYKGPDPVSIRLYQDEKTLLLPSKQELIDKYKAAGISINFVPEGELLNLIPLFYILLYIYIRMCVCNLI